MIGKRYHVKHRYKKLSDAELDWQLASCRRTIKRLEETQVFDDMHRQTRTLLEQHREAEWQLTHEIDRRTGSE